MNHEALYGNRVIPNEIMNILNEDAIFASQQPFVWHSANRSSTHVAPVAADVSLGNAR